MNKLSINNCLNYVVSEQDLNSDLQKIFMRDYQWKIFFNPDISKYA